MKYAIIKIGGSILSNLSETIIEDILTLKKQGYTPIIVHGGGPFINKQLSKMGVESKFEDGLRVTNDEVLLQTANTLIGEVNPNIVHQINQQEPIAIGVNGIDMNLFNVKPLHTKYGFVAECASVNQDAVHNICSNSIPVVAPIGIMRENGQRYNINADSLAYKMASEMKGDLFLISDIPGVLIKDKVKPELSVNDINNYIETTEIYGGMIPKVKGAISAIKEGCKSVKIISGSSEHSLLKSSKSGLIGTTITP
ncbi:acetylglutamate kinase [Mammaliicoccus sp. Dog046]|uniref:acetylglutamate kinase n=1 Tax=Mammaliicoccus sp. Dog046 TaxID=3034233 RepID=UPI002B25B662|nr:acetylglutamate kinase [Mammaliicoccus sp. Dog046]WQK86303.1 acetylglutamate kinase [Mammaliicoccus sp. Dog046]